MFGRNQEKANNYWYEVTCGRFLLIEARES